MPEQFINPKELKGLALPALRERSGYFASRSKYDVAWGDLLIAILTPIGTRPGNRRFGSALVSILFDPSTSNQIERARYVLTESVIEWCPHIRLVNVNVSVQQREIHILVVFSLIADAQLQRRAVTVRRSAGGAQVLAARVA
jgi:phage baseplate assembly protein W